MFRADVPKLGEFERLMRGRLWLKAKWRKELAKYVRAKAQGGTLRVSARMMKRPAQCQLEAAVEGQRQVPVILDDLSAMSVDVPQANVEVHQEMSNHGVTTIDADSDPELPLKRARSSSSLE